MALLDLDLEDADIGVTDLRDPRKLAEQLQKRRRLRVKKGSETIGVFVSASAWRELQERFDALQGELDARDDEALAALLAERIGDEESWMSGSAKGAAGVISSYRQIVKQRRGR
jgi:hypothetical protein